MWLACLSLIIIRSTLLITSFFFVWWNGLPSFVHFFSLRLVNTVFFFSKSDCKNIKNTLFRRPNISAIYGTDFSSLSCQCNKVTNSVYTPLMAALTSGSLECVKLLVKVCIHLTDIVFLWTLDKITNYPLIDFFIWNLSSLHMNELKIQNNHTPLLNLCIFLP